MFQLGIYSRHENSFNSSLQNCFVNHVTSTSYEQNWGNQSCRCFLLLNIQNKATWHYIQLQIYYITLPRHIVLIETTVQLHYPLPKKKLKSRGILSLYMRVRDISLYSQYFNAQLKMGNQSSSKEIWGWGGIFVIGVIQGTFLQFLSFSPAVYSFIVHSQTYTCSFSFIFLPYLCFFCRPQFHVCGCSLSLSLSQ